MTRVGAALSTHPLPPVATGEVVGQVLDAVGPSPDLAVLSATGDLTGVLEDVAATVQAALAPQALIGATATAVIGGARRVETGPAIGLWAARTGVPGVAVHLGAEAPAELDVPDGGEGATLVLLADPYRFPAEAALAALADRAPALAVVGGLVSGPAGVAAGPMVLGGRVVADGAVGVVVRSPTEVVVSPVARPVGRPFVVTRADGQLLHELAGRPALERVQETLAELPAAERALAARGLLCGIVVDESPLDYGRGDFLVRPVLGADRRTGAVAVASDVPVGTTVQLHVHDPATAGADLAGRLAATEAAGALVFSCTARGSSLFADPHHDARIVEAAVGPAVGGLACAGEIGPVAGRNALHTFSASVLLV